MLQMVKCKSTGKAKDGVGNELRAELALSRLAIGRKIVNYMTW